MADTKMIPCKMTIRQQSVGPCSIGNHTIIYRINPNAFVFIYSLRTHLTQQKGDNLKKKILE